jgi:hypothetical protein
MNLYLEQIQKSNEKDKIDEIKKKYKKKREELRKNQESYIEKLKDKLNEFGKDVSAEVLDDYQEKTYEKINQARLRYYNSLKVLFSSEQKELSMLQKAGKLVSGNKYLLAGSVISSAIIITSYEFYKNFTKIALNKCSKYKGNKKTKCIESQRIVALKKRLNFINTKKINCKKSSNPIQCEKELDQVRLKLEEKLNQKIRDYLKTVGSWSVYK